MSQYGVYPEEMIILKFFIVKSDLSINFDFTLKNFRITKSVI